MKTIIAILFLLFSHISYGQNKSITIYNNGVTHDNISADIFNNDTTFTYSVSTAAMWTGKVSTKIVYQSNYNSFISFMLSLLSFAEENKNNKGAKTTIHNINIESTKKLGIKCISIGEGDDINNTNYKSIKNAVESIIAWKSGSMQ